MTKKRSPTSPRPIGWKISRTQIEDWLAEANRHLERQNYPRALEVSKKAQGYLPPNAPERADFYGIMTTAYGMLQQFEESYQAGCKAIEIMPGEPLFWYNRAIAGRYTLRTGQSLRDIEQALKLENNGAMPSKYAKELATAHQLVQNELTLRQPGFTIDALIEQQDWFQKGLQYAAEHRWEDAADANRRSIAIDDCLPQPQGNLGLCLIMLGRLDEAEQALRRALEIKPDYEFAHQNLKTLADVRKTGILPEYGGAKSPFEGKKLKLSLTIKRE